MLKAVKNIWFLVICCIFIKNSSVMKNFLFIICVNLSLILTAQVETVTIDWGRNSTPSAAGKANASRTIEVGDTVVWDWYSTGTHNVFSTSGDTLSSGFGSTGFTFSHTFTVVGTTDYICQPHPSDMFGTITVVAEGTLSTPSIETPISFSIYPNPSRDIMYINIPTLTNEGLKVEVFDVLGKKIHAQNLHKLTSKINIAKWNSGLYLVRLSAPNQSVNLTKRYVKL